MYSCKFYCSSILKLTVTYFILFITATSAQLNMRGVFLHVLGDALGSVVVIVSALIIMFVEDSWRFYVDPALSLIIVFIIISTTIPLCKQSNLVEILVIQGWATYRPRVADSPRTIPMQPTRPPEEKNNIDEQNTRVPFLELWMQPATIIRTFLQPTVVKKQPATVAIDTSNVSQVFTLLGWEVTEELYYRIQTFMDLVFTNIYCCWGYSYWSMVMSKPSYLSFAFDVIFL